MNNVTWENGYMPPQQITGKPHWLNSGKPTGMDITDLVRLVATPEKQSGEFITWAGQQGNGAVSLADIRHFHWITQVLTIDGSCLVEGRYSHFVLAGILFERPEQMRTVKKVTVAGVTSDQTETVTVDVNFVPVMTLYKIDGRPVWGVALYPANQYHGYLGGHDTALVCIQ